LVVAPVDAIVVLARIGRGRLRKESIVEEVGCGVYEARVDNEVVGFDGLVEVVTF